MVLAIDRLLNEDGLQKKLKGKRLALLGHPASVTSKLEHTLDALFRIKGINVVCAFGPQHGMRGDKQDNMIESDDFVDPLHGIPVYSLYGEVRRAKKEWFDKFDVLLIDLQDVGTRVYTFLTTMVYMLEDCARHKKTVWVLDRPNPAGRAIEGLSLQRGAESFVGSLPIPMRHGLTLGELAHFAKAHLSLDLDLEVVKMLDYRMDDSAGYGWPAGELSWVNPSPNIPRVSTVRCYPGTVMIEGTNLSEGRGTTRPLELFGAPNVDMRAVLEGMKEFESWTEGCALRHCYFEPTFQKHAGKLCEGIQIHADSTSLFDYDRFTPYRLMAGIFRVIRHINPEFSLWRDFVYEYEKDRKAIDVINGGPALRTWVEGPEGSDTMEDLLLKDEAAWRRTRESYIYYGNSARH